jgi:hypothetical protein
MNEFVKLLKTTGVPYAENIRGFSPQICSDSDCVAGNCNGGWGACECNCDCAND